MARDLTERLPGILRQAFELGSEEPTPDGSFALRDVLVWHADVEQVELRAIVGKPLRHDSHVEVPFAWQPSATVNAYSSLDGQLELRPEAPRARGAGGTPLKM